MSVHLKRSCVELWNILNIRIVIIVERKENRENNNACENEPRRVARACACVCVTISRVGQVRDATRRRAAQRGDNTVHRDLWPHDSRNWRRQEDERTRAPKRLRWRGAATATAILFSPTSEESALCYGSIIDRRERTRIAEKPLRHSTTRFREV